MSVQKQKIVITDIDSVVKVLNKVISSNNKLAKCVGVLGERVEELVIRVNDMSQSKVAAIGFETLNLEDNENEC